MSDRLRKIYSLPNATYTPTSSIIVEAGNLLLDTNSRRLIAQLKIQNISTRTVSAVKVLLSMREANGTEIGTTEYQYLDLNVPQYQEFGQKTAIYLSGKSVRSYSVCTTEVVYADGKVWQASSNEVVQIPAATELHDYLDDSDLVEQYRTETNARGSYLPEQISDLWRCTCGTVNCIADKKCHVCNTEFDILRLNLDKKILSSKLAERKTEEADQQKKNRKRSMIVLAVIAVIAIILFGIWSAANVIAPQMKYDAAVEQMKRGSYEEAIVAFENLGGYKDSTEKRNEAERRLADQYYDSGDYAAAIQRYENIGTDDAKEQLKACNYQMMLKAIAQKNWADAEAYYEKADNYDDTSNFYDTIQTGKVKELVEHEEYQEAYAILESYIGNEEFKNEMIPMYRKCLYQIALSNYDAKSYDSAAEKFATLMSDETLSGYSETEKFEDEIPTLYNKCLYQIALGDYEAKAFESAAEKFGRLLDDESLGGDAKEQFYLCAKAMYESNKEKAINLFEKVKDYKDSANFLPVNVNSTFADSEQTSETLSKLQGTWRKGWDAAYDEQIIISGSTYKETTYFYNDGTAVTSGVVRISGNRITFVPNNQTYTRYYADGTSASAKAVNSTYSILKLTDTVLNLDGLVYNRQ